MRGAITPLPQYAFMMWCSVKKSTITNLQWFIRSQGSSVSVSTRLRAGRPGFDSRQGLGDILLFTTASRPALQPTQPLKQWEPGFLSPDIKWPGRETDHSPPPNAEIMNS
jgi:hypothetical protein